MTAFEGMGYTASGTFTTLALQQIVAMSSSNLSAQLADLALVQRVGQPPQQHNLLALQSKVLPPVAEPQPAGSWGSWDSIALWHG